MKDMSSMTDKEIEICDMVFDAIEEGNALTIETSRHIYEDCAVLKTTEEVVTVSWLDIVKGRERELDIEWDDIIKVTVF